MIYDLIMGQVRQRPIMVPAWFSVFFVVVGLNFLMGNKVGGFLVGLGFVGIAVLGAWAASEAPGAPRGRKGGLYLLVVLQLALGQWCGWQQLGINLSSGAASLMTDADVHNTASGALKSRKAEQAALGTPRAIEAIAAERDLECKRTSRAYPDGNGPVCTKLKAEEANAKRYHALGTEIDDAALKLAATPPSDDGDAAWAVPQAFGGYVASWIMRREVKPTSKDVIFWFSIFLTFLLEYVATCGPWLLDLQGHRRPAAEAVAAWDFGPRLLPSPERMTPVPTDQPDHYLRGNVGATPDQVAGVRYPAAGGFSGSAVTQAPHGPAPSGGHMHGAPINISFGVSPAGSGAHGAGAQGAVVQSAEHAAGHGSLAPAHHAPGHGPAFSPAAPHVPVERGRINELMDHLLCFRAACVVEQSGATTTGDELFDRYRAWAGPRAIARAAFETMFAEVTGIEKTDFGGLPHYRNVGLVGVAHLAAVNG